MLLVVLAIIRLLIVEWGALARINALVLRQRAMAASCADPARVASGKCRHNGL
jgi:hypothetical protein